MNPVKTCTKCGTPQLISTNQRNEDGSIQMEISCNCDSDPQHTFKQDDNPSWKCENCESLILERDGTISCDCSEKWYDFVWEGESDSYPPIGPSDTITRSEWKKQK